MLLWGIPETIEKINEVLRHFLWDILGRRCNRNYVVELQKPSTVTRIVILIVTYLISAHAVALNKTHFLPLFPSHGIKALAVRLVTDL